MPQFLSREMVEQAGEGYAVSAGECGPADLALQHLQLVSQGEDLDVFVSVPQLQQAQERKGVGRGKVGQTQQHGRS